MLIKYYQELYVLLGKVDMFKVLMFYEIFVKFIEEFLQ